MMHRTPTLSLFTRIFLSIVLLTLTSCVKAVAQPNQGFPVTSQPTGGTINTPHASQSALPDNEQQGTAEYNPTEVISSTTVSSNTSGQTPPLPFLQSFATDLPPDYWMSLPIIPSVSQTAREIYQHGTEMGRDPHAFSKIGDCQSIKTYFLNYFDNPELYRLGEYASLQDTIDWYAGSFSRDSLAVKGGFNAAAILSPLRADPNLCHSDENPIACELRLQNPSIAIISLEEWWAGHPENYEAYMRQIIEYAIQQGVVPIVATKADNLEGNHLINQTIARLALEYDIPLWNFWLAVQPLPNHGLAAVDVYGEADMFHLTHSDNYYFYDDPNATQSGWAMRNLTALQALDAIRRGLTSQP